MVKKIEIEVGSLLSDGSIFIGNAQNFQPIGFGVTEDWVGDFAVVRNSGEVRVGTLMKVGEGEWDVTAMCGEDGEVEAFVVKPLGLDRHPELREMYFGNYRRVLYIAQTDDPALTEKARAAAEFLGLPFERQLTGYGDLAPALQQAGRLVKAPQS